YTPAGQIKTSTDGKGNLVQYRYNSLGKVRERRDQLGGTEQFQYDAEGNLALYIDRDGKQVHRSYNALGNLVYERAVDEKGEHPCIRTYRYDSIGRLMQAVSDGHSYEYQYDEKGRLKEKRSSGKRLVSYEYDPAGRIRSMTDPAGVTTRYEYDLLGRMNRIHSKEGMEVCYEYDCLDRITRLAYGNGVETEYRYDGSGNIETLETKKGERILLSFCYAYDGNGNRIHKKGRQRLPDGTEREIDISYGYNLRNQLMEETRNGAATKYSYDAAGNRLRKEDCEGVTEYHYNEKNQVILLESPSGKKQFTYSRQGSILTEEGAEGTRRYVYNSRNQQIRVEWKRGIQENRYDAEGLGYETEENGQRFRFVYHNGELLYEGGDREETSYHTGAGIEGFKRNGERFYYHQDEQLSEALITDTGGRIQNHYQYDAFGAELNAMERIPNRIRYTGQQYDQATEQYYLRARYYNPILGRFMQEDEYLGDGLNLYAYCENNPVVYYDPSGYSSYEAKVGSGIGDEGGSGAGESGSNPKNVFPENPDDLLPEIPRNKVTKANGTTSQTIQTSDNIRIRAEQHPLLPGETYNPRHHGVHYHVEYKVDPTKSWNNKNNVKKWYPEGYTPGAGSGFIPGETFPE
ncbi:MAG: RHS repeat-associated core domain-containing protein, partial [Clostridiales bacterium]|nr:RHS repeat-associated core domain-containing protein [Clostridiales bacterium]